MRLNYSKILFIFFFIYFGFLLSSCQTKKLTVSKEQPEKVINNGPEKVEVIFPNAKAEKEAEKELKNRYSEILGLPSKEIKNISLFKFVEEWNGIPYKYGGRTKSGVDCSNFTSLLYDSVFNIGISGSSASIFQQCKKHVEKSELKEGDLVFFKIKQDRVSHVGVYLENNKFIHATIQKGVMINDLDEAYYKKYYFKAGRFIN
jgi:murein DD-endopeptidase / murein LD-carboxypeptidase